LGIILIPEKEDKYFATSLDWNEKKEILTL
jgi:hypothetical protein